MSTRLRRSRPDWERGQGARVIRRGQGFSLPELVIVIAISGIVAATVTALLARPLEGYVALERRAELVDVAEMALRRLQRDVRRALPNSVRVTMAGTRTCVEMMTTVDGVSYRAGPPPGPQTRWLEFDAADGDFNILGHFRNLVPGVQPAGRRLAVYSTGATDAGGTPLAGANVYAAPSLGPTPPVGSHIITPAGTTITITTGANEDQVNLSPGHQFAFSSPQQRAYLVEGVVSYMCDTAPATRTLTRYWDYTLNAAQACTVAGLTSAGSGLALVANQVSGCNFAYAPGDLSRRGQLTAQLAIQDAPSAEQVTLLHQIHVDNVP